MMDLTRRVAAEKALFDPAKQVSTRESAKSG
jgi:hypothetical protein